MIDFHTHTYLSDGLLGPAEHIREAEIKGYSVLGISDHADLATLEMVAPIAIAAAQKENALGLITVLAGVELTHVRPQHIAEGVSTARKLGVQFVIVHGETIVEPVVEGTNRAGIEAGADILAHPGLITDEDAALAAEAGVFLEVSAKAGHCLCNGHVVQTARRTGAKLLFGSDAHSGSQMPTKDFAKQICRAAGMTDQEITEAFESAAALAEKIAS